MGALEGMVGCGGEGKFAIFLWTRNLWTTPNLMLMIYNVLKLVYSFWSLFSCHLVPYPHVKSNLAKTTDYTIEGDDLYVFETSIISMIFVIKIYHNGIFSYIRESTFWIWKFFLTKVYFLLKRNNFCNSQFFCWNFFGQKQLWILTKKPLK